MDSEEAKEEAEAKEEVFREEEDAGDGLDLWDEEDSRRIVSALIAE